MLLPCSIGVDKDIMLFAPTKDPPKYLNKSKCPAGKYVSHNVFEKNAPKKIVNTYTTTDVSTAPTLDLNKTDIVIAISP